MSDPANPSHTHVPKFGVTIEEFRTAPRQNGLIGLSRNYSGGVDYQWVQDRDVFVIPGPSLHDIIHGNPHIHYCYDTRNRNHCY